MLPSILFSLLPHHSLHLYFTPLSTLFAFLRSVVALPTLDLTFLTSCLRLEIQFISPCCFSSSPPFFLTTTCYLQ